MKNWISTKDKDKLPPIGTKVLISNGEWRLIGERDEYFPDKWYVNLLGYMTLDFESEEVTHWMPLPELPEVS